jgi:uncharacterized protein
MSPVLLVVLLSALALGSFRILRYRRHGFGIPRALGVSLNWRAVRDAAVGIAVATLAVLAIFATAYAANAIDVTGIGSPAPLWNDIPSFVMVPFLEELIFRSALLGGLLIMMPNRAWAAILISAAVFGMLHLGNSHATALTALGSTFGGIAYGIAFAATQSLWLPFGLHFAWNYVQGPVLGFALSGGKPLRGTLIQLESVGPTWFTGGEYGPEGGAVGLVGRAVVIIGLFAVVQWRRRSPLSGLPDAIPAARSSRSATRQHMAL